MTRTTPTAPAPTGRTALAAAGSAPRRAFILFWAAAWAVVGCGIAAGITLLSDLDPGPALRMSILFAEVVGFTAFVSARMVFPWFERMPWAVSFPLQVLTLLSGTVFGSVIVVVAYPLLSIRQFRLVALIVVANAVIAVVVGIALHTYDTMRRQIETSYRALREKEALERELRFARDVQQQLLPSAVPELRGLEVSGLCIPAAGVGGDYYDFLPLSDDEVGLVIADVSGKGVSAALLMAGLQAAVRLLARPGADPAELMSSINRMLHGSSPSARYATLFLGIYDTRTRALRYCNAGHHPPVVVGANGVAALAGGGIPIGLFEEARYPRGERRLEPGELLALFTDGLVEAPDPGDTQFGTARLIEHLATHRGLALDAVGREILDSLRAWSAGADAHDDVTLVLARVR
jgi:serine phosphatase RsbU (regulator of sigma subunit)